MQKRLLALVATVAMVLSMFAGVAFADSPVKSDPKQVNTRVYDLRWYSENAPLTAVKVKDNTINYYADYRFLEETETVGVTPYKATWIGIGILPPSFVTAHGYYYTLTREDGTTATGYAELDTFAGDKKGLEWNLDVDEWQTAEISIKWLNEAGQQVGFDETFTFNYFDTRLEQVSEIYSGEADFQVTENGEVVELDGYQFKVSGCQENELNKTYEGEKDAYTITLKVEDQADVELLINDNVVSKLTVEASDTARLYEVQGFPTSIKVGELKEITPVYYYEDAADVRQKAGYFEISYSGAGVSKTEVEINADASFTLKKTNKPGTLTFTVKAYDQEDGNHLGTDVVEVKVTGLTATVEPATHQIKTAGTVVVTLQDEEEAPINHATIKFMHGETIVLKKTAKELKPNNGVYEIEFKATSDLVKVARELDVVAVLDTDTDEEYQVGTFTVLGAPVYDLTTDIDGDILAGRDQKVVFSVTEDGKVVRQPVVKVLDADGDVVNTGNIRVVRSGDDYTITLPAFTEAGEYTLVVSNADESKIGTEDFVVVEPVLELSAEKLTNNVTSAFTARLLDPTNEDAVLKWEVRVAPKHVTVESLKLDDRNAYKAGGYYRLGRMEEYELSALVTADYDAADDAEEVAGLEFTVIGDKAVVISEVFAVADAKLVCEPEEPVYGQNGTVTLKLVDANEAPLAGYKVYRFANQIGTTDEKGEVVYRGRMTDMMTFRAELDVEEKDVELTVIPVDDNMAPTVTYEEEVDTNKTTIVVEDNVGLARVRINGAEIDLFGRNPYEHEVTLVPGVNKFHVEALDTEGNRFDEVIEIKYVSNDVVLEGNQVQRQGEFLFVQLRQFEELGAEFAWNQEAKVATFVVGDTKVEVTIGSTTAKVNGEAVTMPVAAFIDAAQGRTYVPVRFVSEALGWNVHWAQGDIVTITLP